MTRGRQASAEGIAWVHASTCLPSIDLLRHMGAPVDRELGRHKLPLHPLDPVNDILPRDQFLAFCAGMASTEHSPDLGFEAASWAQRDNPPYAPSGPPTLYRALVKAAQKASEHTTMGFFLAETEQAVAFCRPVDPFHEAHDSYAGCFALQTIRALVRRYAGRSWVPPRVGAPLRLTTRHWFRSWSPGTMFVPSGDSWWLEVPRSEIAKPPIEPDGRATPSAVIPAASDHADIIEHIVRTYVPSRKPTLRFVAELVGTSPRTIRRRLRQKDRSFAGILREARFDHACRLLEDSDQPITEIAFDMGYASPSNFARAFRRAAGITPRRFRASRAR